MMKNTYATLRSLVARTSPDWLRESLVYQALRRLDLTLSKRNFRNHNGITEAMFKGGKLDGQTILFPATIKGIDWIETEIPGYFALDTGKLRPGSTVYDGGAWPGEFTVLASRIVGQTGRVYAFEPNPLHLKDLEQVLKLNGCNNVDIIDLALTDKDASTARLTLDGVGSMIIGQNDSSKQRTVNVKTTSIDAFTKKSKAPDFVKLDVEGAEIDVVDGAIETIQGYRPAWAIASYHKAPNGGQTSKPIEETLRKSYQNVLTTYPIHRTTFAFNR